MKLRETEEAGEQIVPNLTFASHAVVGKFMRALRLVAQRGPLRTQE